MPKIFALRSRLFEVQNSLLQCNTAHGVGKEEQAHDSEAHKAEGHRGSCGLPWPSSNQGPAWDEDWGSSLLVGCGGGPPAVPEVPEPPKVAVVVAVEDEDDTDKPSDEIQTRLQCEEEEPAPAPADHSASCAPSPRDLTPPPKERPQFRRKRDKRRNPRMPLLGESDRKPEIRKSKKGTNSVIRRKSRNPGLRGQELSPNCLYSRPPEEDNETGAGNQGEQESDGTSNNGSSSGSSTNGSPSGNSGSNDSASGGGNGVKGSRGVNGGGGGGTDEQQQMDFEEFEYPDSPTQKWLADNADLSPLTVLDNINLKTEFPTMGANGQIDKPPDLNNAAAVAAAVNAATQPESVAVTTVGHNAAPVTSVTSSVASSTAAVMTAPPTMTTTAAVSGMDPAAAENLLQFAASVPVPDSSATFLDIGTDSFSQSLYDDLGDINLTDFGNNNQHGMSTSSALAIAVSALAASSGGHPAETNNNHLLSAVHQPMQIPNTVHLQPMTTSMPPPVVSVPAAPTTTTVVTLQPKPVTLEKINHPLMPSNPVAVPVQLPPQHQPHNINLGDLMRIKAEPAMMAMQPKPMPDAPASLRNLVEPLPASALMGLIKVEQQHQLFAAPVPVCAAQQNNLVKVEHMTTEHLTQLVPPPPPQSVLTLEMVNQAQQPGEIQVFSPMDTVSHPSPGSPASGGSVGMGQPGSPHEHQHEHCGKVKGSPSRKKSTSSTDEDDISNIPSLKMRIQVISQRLGIPPDMPIELINGGHGFKNPMSPDGTLVKTEEKLPPVRPDSDPSKFQCRTCSKQFTLQRLLNRHMKCHSDTKRYLCTFCGKGFNDTFDLKRHTRTHTGVRPYKCNMCEKSFTQRCSLESHCLKVHGHAHQYDYKQRRSKVYVCEDCGATTKEPEVHYLHLKENHPFSPALLKFYDKRHFKFTNSNFASMLLQVNS